jgi:hypothetical protein
MKIIAFIEARQSEVIEKIRKHCNLWNPPQPRPPPRPSPRSPPTPAQRLAQRTRDGVEIDPDFLEHLHREEQADQMQLPCD